MNIDEVLKLGIQPDIVKKLKEENIQRLYPPQEDAIKSGLLKGENVILSVPTAAGKTLIATLAAVNKLSKKGAKAVYIVPLVALANEKYEYYKKLFKRKWKVALSVGDLDSSDPKLSEYDLIICTTEKLDSLIRHGSRWIDEIELVIIDEIHMLNDPSRGPTLEILITQLKEIIPSAQFLGLSATISNSDELADWLDSELVISDFRPVKLYEGVSFGEKIKFFDKDDYRISGIEAERSILKDTLKLKKQAIFFTSTRRNAESLAERLAITLKQELTGKEKQKLEKVSSNILNTLESPTRQCKKLAECVKYGSAFHHAGLMRKQKRLIEDNFREGVIKSISTTPTLAMGVNLPAFRVIVRDTRRYYRGLGNVYIPVLEYKQIVGRAGRPQYDEYGESILFAKNEGEAEKLTDHYIFGEPEKIRSKLSIEPILRMHVLSLISNSFAGTKEALFEFFSKTFYAYQYGDISSIEEKVDEILEDLESWHFIMKKNNKVKTTRLGKRVTELYLDPLTAHNFVTSMENLRQKLEPFGVLQLISNTSEMFPTFLSSSEHSKINQIIAERGHMLLQKAPPQWDFEFERFMRSIKTSMLIEAWINEKTDDDILREFKIAPGELRSRLKIADWLLYSLQELMLLMGMKEHLKDIRKIRIRVMYGAREELLPLVKLKSIGRIRARKLFSSNIRSLDDLRKVPIRTLSHLLGPNIAKTVKDQLGEKTESKKKQSSLRIY